MNCFALRQSRPVAGPRTPLLGGRPFPKRTAMFPPFQVRSEPNLWLKMALVVALGAVATLGFALMAHGADAPPMPIADPPKAVLTLDAPKSVPAGSGYFKIRAAAAGPVSFDVEAQFDDQAVVFQSEQLDAATLLVGVPASAGVIRVEAAVAV